MRRKLAEIREDAWAKGRLRGTDCKVAKQREGEEEEEEEEEEEVAVVAKRMARPPSLFRFTAQIGF